MTPSTASASPSRVGDRDDATPARDRAYGLPGLRLLAEQQRFEALREQCLAGACVQDLPALRPLLALALAHLGDTTAAAQALEGVAPAELDPDARADLAAAHLALGRIDQAVALLTAVLRDTPDHALALARLALCRLAAQDDPDAAAELFQRSAAIAPRVPVLLNLARLRLEADAVDAAKAALGGAREALAALGPDWPAAQRRQLAAQCDTLQMQTWVHAGRFADAEAWLAALSDPDNHLAWLQEYARLLTQHAHHAQAEDLLRDALQAHPDSVPLLTQLAELASLQGQVLTATRLLKRAIAREPEAVALHVQLAQASLLQSPAQARQAAETAVRLADAQADAGQAPAGRLQARHALAQVEAQAQRLDAAERLFDEILAEAPDFAPALQGLGQLAMQRGRIDAAVALFERLQAVDPVKGQAALIGARRFPEDDASLAQLERATRRPDLEGAVRNAILFKLAAAWEKRGEYDRAFTLADEANAASRPMLPYDGRAHRNQCARIRARFDRALYEHRPDTGVDSTLPVFVVGMPRSGTTLVEQIVAGHSRIFGAGELGIIPRTVQGLNRWERHVGSGRRYPDCADDLSPEISRGIAENLLAELRDYAPDADHVVDKLPHNFEHIGLIKLLFPNARIISVRRDPRDIAISNFFTDFQAKHGGMGFAYDLTDIGQQLADHNLLMHHWQQVFPGQILEIDYEDVVADLEGSARKLLDYIGVDWEPAVLDFDKLDRPVRTASVWQVRQPIYHTSLAKWRRYADHLAPLIAGTNAAIRPDPVDMISLPEAGLLAAGMARYHADDLDGAEHAFKRMLHHNPTHAACTFMVGLVYVRKGHLAEGIARMEQAVTRLPHKRDWRNDLILACELAGDTARAARWRADAAAPDAEPSTEDGA